MWADPALILALAAVGGATATVAPAPAVATLVAGCCIVAARARHGVLLLALVAFSVSALRARFALDQFEGRWLEARSSLGEPRRCSGLARVVASPVRTGGLTGFTARLADMECEGRTLRDGTHARLYGGPEDLRRGDTVELVAQLAPIRLFRNAELADPTTGAARRSAVVSGMTLSAVRVSRQAGVRGLIDGARNATRRRIDATFARDAAPLARALVLGENDLESADDLAFKQSGLAHLLAVSGTHLVLAVATVVRAMTAFLVRIEWLATRLDVGRIAAGIGVPLALGYADFAGGSGSAWRAAWMLAAAFVARACGRHPRPLRTLALSFLVGAAADPLVVFDVSFLLSAAATSGLVASSALLSSRVRRVPWRPLRFVVSSVVTTLSAMLPCVPLLALLSPDVTAAGVAANVVAAPIGELVALPLCLLHPLTWALPWLEQGTALVASGALLCVRAVAHVSASARWAAIGVPVPSTWQLAVLLLCLLGLWVSRRRGAWLALVLVALVGLEMRARSEGRPDGLLRVTVLDVGQGDAALVDLPDGTLMLVDGGGFVGSPVDPGQRVILPLLRARRRSRIDVMVVSHPHPDHYGGLVSVLAAVEVGELWDSGQGEANDPRSAYAGLLRTARSRGIPVQRPADLCGQPRRHGAALVRVLGPCPAAVPGRGANDNSLVIALSLGRRTALLVGDAEQEQERSLLDAGLLAHADLLKVGHHGSRTSSSEGFLDRVTPDAAVISCGVRNRFGHPHAQTVEALARREVHTLRTDRVGGVLWLTDGEITQIETALPEPRGSRFASTLRPATSALLPRPNAADGGDPG